MPFELPLFPLNVVLFPGMRLPLHIFEPRYRLMIRRCLDHDRTFGVALIAEGEEGQPGTVPAATGCAAEIVEFAPLEDGRMNLQTVGRRRFRVLALREEDDYLIGTVEWLDDDLDGSESEELAQRVGHSLRRYLLSLARNINLSDVDLDDLEMPDDPYDLSMMVAALITLTRPNEEKQALLELTSTTARLKLELNLLRRSEVIQQAFARRVASGLGEPPHDESLGPLAPHVSLN